MLNKIHAFSIPLGAAQPGFTSTELEARKKSARNEARCAMPSLSSLVFSYMDERVTSDGDNILLAFDLIESPQMQLALMTPGTRRKTLVSAVTGLTAELNRLKEDARNTVIRIGEFAELSSMLPSMDDEEFADAIGRLTGEDGETWRLMNSRRGKSLSLSFPDESIGITFPLFPVTTSERGTRIIQCRVTSICGSYANLDEIRDLDDRHAPGRVFLPCQTKMQLKRPSNSKLKTADEWFLLYGAEYSQRTVDAEVRMALREVDFQPSHLELIEILGRDELVDVLPKYQD